MNFEITGNLIGKENEQQISASFKKREFVVEVVNERNSDWNDFIKFQLTQDRCNLIDGLTQGQQIKVCFNVRGRKWEKDGKVNYFTTLEAWRVELLQPAQVPTQQNEVPPSGENDMPF